MLAQSPSTCHLTHKTTQLKVVRHISIQASNILTKHGMDLCMAWLQLQQIQLPVQEGILHGLQGGHKLLQHHPKVFPSYPIHSCPHHEF